MPAVSKAQRRLFALALLYKRGELSSSQVSDEVKDLSKLPESKLREYAGTEEIDLPEYTSENLTLNPNMNVNGMGSVELPGNPGSANSFSTQTPGSGDFMDIPKKKRKIISLRNFIRMKK